MSALPPELRDSGEANAYKPTDAFLVHDEIDAVFRQLNRIDDILIELEPRSVHWGAGKRRGWPNGLRFATAPSWIT